MRYHSVHIAHDDGFAGEGVRRMGKFEEPAESGGGQLRPPRSGPTLGLDSPSGRGPGDLGRGGPLAGTSFRFDRSAPRATIRPP